MNRDGKLIFIAITLLVNAANYLLNILLARWLGPAYFAEANLLSTLVLFLSFIAVGVQLTIAKLVAANQSGGLYSLRRKLVKVAYGSTIVLLLLAYPLAVFLNLMEVWPLVILFLGLPAYLLMCFDRGQFQGREEFSKLGYTFLIEMLIRFLLTISLALILPIAFSSYAFAIGFLGSFVLTQYFFKQELIMTKGAATHLKSIYLFLKVITLYELSQILINNADVLLVNHLFSDIEAGLYASIAILGKAVFFATSIVVTILFPKVIDRKRQGLSHTRLFWTSFLIVFCVGMLMVLAAAVAGQQVMLLAFGEAYAGVSDCLWQYALLTCLFSCSNIFVYYYMTLDAYWPVVISVVAGVIQVASILIYGTSIVSVLAIQLYVMAALLLVLLTYHFIKHFSWTSAKVATPALSNSL